MEEKNLRSPIKGRGALDNLHNRFEKISIGEAYDGWDLPEEQPSPKTQIFFDQTKSILSTNNSPDVGIEVSINPYRGCEHGCIYCYARPTHEYLGLSSGLDFETKIFVKKNAAELLRKALAQPSWEPKTITISGVTDCYQPLEKKFQITRQCLEVLAEFRNPVFLITKNYLVTRDLDLLSEMAKFNLAGVMVSMTTLDNDLCAKMEPRTARPQKRLEAISRLRDAGVAVGVNVAPILPGLTDHEMPKILEAARKAGALFAGYTILRLPYGVKDLFADWLKEHYPERENKVLHRIEDLRGGKRNDSTFGTRMTGTGIFAEQIRNLFLLTRKRLAFPSFPGLSTNHFHRPHNPQGQLALF